MTYTSLLGEATGPVRVAPDIVHNAARRAVSMRGGEARVLRVAGDGWREVACYTDRGAGLVEFADDCG
jgi:hypothetical protein